MGGVNKMNNFDLPDFKRYFYSFYGENGLYPIENLIDDDILRAIEILHNENEGYEFISDSVDRENVRDIIFRWKNLVKDSIKV